MGSDWTCAKASTTSSSTSHASDAAWASVAGLCTGAAAGAGGVAGCDCSAAGRKRCGAAQPGPEFVRGSTSVELPDWSGSRGAGTAVCGASRPGCAAPSLRPGGMLCACGGRRGARAASAGGLCCWGLASTWQCQTGAHHVCCESRLSWMVPQHEATTHLWSAAEHVALAPELLGLGRKQFFQLLIQVVHGAAGS